MNNIQMANGWSCNGTRFRVRWKIDVLFNEAKPSWIECRSFTEWEISYHCTNHTISHLCCTTPRMITKLNTIDKNLVPWISQISSCFFLVAKYSQPRPTRNACFIHKTISGAIRSRKSTLRSAKLLWHHTHCWEWYELHDYCATVQDSARWAPIARRVHNKHDYCATVQDSARGAPIARRVHNKLSRCCTAIDKWVQTCPLVCLQTWGAFHQAFCQCFSLTNLLSANQMQGFQ